MNMYNNFCCCPISTTTTVEPSWVRGAVRVGIGNVPSPSGRVPRGRPQEQVGRHRATHNWDSGRRSRSCESHHCKLIKVGPLLSGAPKEVSTPVTDLFRDSQDQLGDGALMHTNCFMNCSIVVFRCCQSITARDFHLQNFLTLTNCR